MDIMLIDRPMRPSLSKGFTLIELLTAVIILAILVALVTANFIEQKKRIGYNLALGEVRAIAAAAKNYFFYSGFYPTTTNTDDTSNSMGFDIPDGVFGDYRLQSSGSDFTVIASTTGGGAVATYVFDSKGRRLSCSGTGCLPL
jgi:prepilin-type N-terminal cleavage/methylation domain-containing protein